MKKMFFLGLFTTSSILLFAQNDKYKDKKHRQENVPQVVQQSYQREYPNYNNSTWDQRNNQWHTRYMDRDHNRNVDVYYDRSGRRVLTQSDWDRDDVPVTVKERIRRKYHDENYNVYRIERPGRGILFQITLGGNNNRRVYFDENGREVRYNNRY
jgi:hypothetical protein